MKELDRIALRAADKGVDAFLEFLRDLVLEANDEEHREAVAAILAKHRTKWVALEMMSGADG